MGQSKEVADAVVWLFSNEARCVTGQQSLRMDCGFRPLAAEMLNAADCASCNTRSRLPLQILAMSFSL
ncbi:hypothetical protein [Pseudomonas sp.]|uniref:hypothetical protein n=1 Tax=Pseudomonas sp. TaxID=306 RepID=UPI00345DBBDB